MKKVVYILISILLTIMIAYGFNLDITLAKALVLGIVMFIIVSFLNEKVRKIDYNTLLNAILFSIFMEIGICYEKWGSLSYIWSEFSHFIYLILTLGSFIYLFYIIINYIKIVLDYDYKERIVTNKFWKYVNDHLFWCTFVFIFLISCIYLVFYYPGSMAYDGMWQLDFYYKELDFSNHHQASFTFVMGFLMDVGKYFGSDNLGMFLFIFLQVIINALVYSYVVINLKKMKVSFKWIVVTILFYGMFPLLSINSITYIKDTLFYLVFLFMLVYVFYHFYYQYDENNYWKYIVLLFLLLSLYLIRNTGFYIAIISLIFWSIYMFIKDKKAGVILGFLFLGVLGFNYFYNSFFLVKLDIKSASPREMMSIPFQQTGRYLKEYPNDLSKEEIEVLNSVFETDYSKISSYYNPNIADGIKMKFIEYPDSSLIKEYFKVWFNMGLRHPFVYIDATLNSIYGYFYPCDQNFLKEMLGFYDIEVNGEVVNTDKFNFKRNNLKWGRDAFYELSEIMEDTFLISLLYRPAFYNWVLIISSFYVWGKKKRNLLILFVPLYVVVLLCMVSPVNAHMRYLQPVMVCTPFVIGILLSSFEKKRNWSK